MGAIQNHVSADGNSNLIKLIVLAEKRSTVTARTKYNSGRINAFKDEIKKEHRRENSSK